MQKSVIQKSLCSAEPLFQIRFKTGQYLVMENQSINGLTRLIGLIGNPVGHSLSPYIHNHALRQLNLPYVYVPLCVKKTDLYIVVQALRSIDFAGANVTVPYKSAIVHYCDVLSEVSQLTGTVNTLYVNNGLLYGTTTDGEGFLKALRNMACDLKGTDVVILGNGGTAQTLGVILAQGREINSLCFAGRDQKKALALAEMIYIRAGLKAASVALNSPEFSVRLKNCSLLINCTNVGTSPQVMESPLPADSFSPAMTVFDVIYNPQETLFLRYAREAGCRTQNGLAMLLYQALASFRYWTGVEAPQNLFDLDELQGLVSRVV
jgi:shikimate dehydrogenase